MNHEVLSCAFSPACPPAWALLGVSRAPAFQNPHSEHPSSVPWPSWSTESSSVQRLPAAHPASPPRRPLQPPTGPGRTSTDTLGRTVVPGGGGLAERTCLPGGAEAEAACLQGPPLLLDVKRAKERTPVSIVPVTCSRHFVPSWPFMEGTRLGVIPNSFQLQPQTAPSSGPLGSLGKV